MSFEERTRKVESFGVPKCFTPEQWRLWVSAARSIPPLRRDGYCADCQSEYQNEMLMQGRCDHPETIFIIGKDGFVEGIRPGRNAHDTKPMFEFDARRDA
jgi:hypothetical protein